MSDGLENRVDRVEDRLDRVERLLEQAVIFSLDSDKKRAEDEKAWKLRHAELEEAITVLVHTVDEWIRNNPRGNGGPGSVQKS